MYLFLETIIVTGEPTHIISKQWYCVPQLHQPENWSTQDTLLPAIFNLLWSKKIKPVALSYTSL